MAEGEAKDTNQVVCPFYLYSSYDYGDKCLYHDIARSDSKNIPCSFFLKGNCKFGDRCWYLHSTIKHDANSMTTLINDEQIVEPFSHSMENGNILTPESDVNNVAQSNYNSQSFCSVQTNQSVLGDPTLTTYLNSPEFQPKDDKSYSDVVKTNNCIIGSETKKWDMEYCEHIFNGVCPNPRECKCIHGDYCEICQTYCLNPDDEKQRNSHTEHCLKELLQDMEYSFAVQRSLDKTCGICFEVIMEKNPAERFFGILENCNHIYCLACIRGWRSTETRRVSEEHVENLLDPAVVRSCPECRIHSHFITPSVHWVDEKIQKEQLISEYKLTLSKKPCKYFRQGEGTCPFGGACFYLHAKPDGTKVVLPSPSRRRRQNQDGEFEVESNMTLWDYLEVRNSSYI